MNTANRIVGWDVGGAHLKAALVERDEVVDVMQIPCTLWQGLEYIDAAVASVRARWPQAREASNAVTMTGEMVDLFPDREAGVVALVQHLVHTLGVQTRFFAASAWLPADEAVSNWQQVASANWLASATWVAGKLDEALLIDIGSTTTDVIPVRGARVVARGQTDAARLSTGELVYQGVVRTPLCALAQRVRFGGIQCNVMNEWFATSADVYRLTGELEASFDQHDTADHRGKERPETCARLARLIGRDARDAAEADWLDLARAFRVAQMWLIEENVAQVLAASALSADAPVVAAGCGDFLAREIAGRIGRRCVDFDQLLGATGSAARWARVCAPSAAVALLLGVAQEARTTRLVCGS